MGEPVAIETQLGWVVSAPLESSQSTERVSGQCISYRKRQYNYGKLEEDIKVLWDLETLGIAERDRVYEEFVDNITFNGNRYSIKVQ